MGSAAASAALTQSQPPQRPRTQNQVGGPIQASDQGAFAGGHPGAMAQGSANSEVAAYAADSGIELAGRSSVNAVLTKPVDFEEDQAWRPSHGVHHATRTNIRRPAHPKGGTLVGQVSEANAC